LSSQPYRLAGVAQSVEQRTRNAKVVGSIPISGTSFFASKTFFSLKSEASGAATEDTEITMILKKFSRLAVAFAFLACLAACSTHKDFYATSGSRADGVIDLAYDFNSLETPVVDQKQAYTIARSKCSLWGYVDAEPFGGTSQECTARGGFGDCSAWRVSKKYQCLGNLGSVSAPINYLSPAQGPVTVPPRQTITPYQMVPSPAPAPLSSSEYRERQINLLMQQNLPYDEYQKKYQAIMAQ
jgi:hypothetical protein